MTGRSATLPASRPSRVVVEAVAPLVDGGAFPAKATIGELVMVTADVFADGHDQAAAALRFRHRQTAWQEVPMAAQGNDRFAAPFVPDVLGRWQYQVVGWLDHLGTWRHGMELKLAAGSDVGVDIEIGLVMIAEAIGRARQDDVAALTALRRALDVGDTRPLDRHRVDPDDPATDDGFVPDLRDVEPDDHGPDALDELFWRTGKREPSAELPRPVDLQIDRERARFSAWYEFFPRSTLSPTTGHATLADAVNRLDHIADMGFDVVYVPPVHPIGLTGRKGPNNAIVVTPDDVGSPWAIGATDGGHTLVHRDLGTVADVTALAQACGKREMELALDIAFQCTPDHPWVTEHPEWFAHRPDGTIQYAENPPKKYQDIYPLDFESADWQGLWTALADVVRFWIDAGVTIFRVDNPHTKAFAFWEWLIADVHREHPDAIFLAEAFTRPRVMERLAKIGFNQSYTYFTWRQSSWELREYFEDLSARTVDSFRPNAWPNTPDILTEQLQTGSRAMFASRAVLAATLSPSWGVYGPAFELLEHLPMRPGSEEYLDSEKYQLRQWELDDAASLAPLLGQLNRIRRAHPAFAHLRTLRFHGSDNPALLCYSKTDPDGGGPILVVVNLDAEQRQHGIVDVDLAALGIEYESTYDVIDELGGATFRWKGSHNFVDLDPAELAAHVFRVAVLS
ncbi:MAG: alpha-1,4-glucan--maltose-1-phosphate maltosyltransferase [Actinomycetota bacterium]|jgi:starch synthase (maltosyl-transferring)|nr:alpha-1,4-glucan--maltose-1-phosphate maltosyltransferase [Actinomycetota bacterium]